MTCVLFLFGPCTSNDHAKEVDCQTRKKAASQYVFLDRDGRPVKSDRKAFRSALKRAGITNFKFHDLRHTFASHYLMRGGSLKNLQQILGHKDIKMTMRYSHLLKEFQREEIQKMNHFTKSQWSNLVNFANGQSLEGWSGRPDLNRRPPEPHSGALPGCATSR